MQFWNPLLKPNRPRKDENMVTQIKKSGTHTSIKIVSSIVNLLTSVKSKKIQPEKGTKNPPHIQYKLPKSVAQKVKDE